MSIGMSIGWEADERAESRFMSCGQALISEAHPISVCSVTLAARHTDSSHEECPLASPNQFHRKIPISLSTGVPLT